LTYLGEFRRYWPNLIGATMGMGFGIALNHYLMNLFGPELIEEFGWSKSQFALIGLVSIFMMVFVPIAGRFTDVVGSRIAAIIGFIAVPLGFLAYSFQTGSFYQFFAITVMLTIFGVLSATQVFTRVVVERFDTARGMSLAIVMTGSPLVGAIIVPIIGNIIETEGWRVAYRILAAISATGGIVAVSMIGKSHRAPRSTPDQAQPDQPSSFSEIVKILRHPTMLLLIAGMMLCNIPHIIVSSQLKLVLMENHAPSQLATYIISLYAGGVVVGRFLSGIALDRVQAHVVAVFALGLPAIGFVALALPYDAAWVLAGAVLLMGLAQGAEGDVGAYLASRKFDMKHYSFLVSILIAAMGLASAAGSVILSYNLVLTGSYNAFLIISAVATIFGALAFFLTGHVGKVEIDNHPKGDENEQLATGEIG